MRARPILIALIAGLSPAVAGCGPATDTAKQRSTAPAWLSVKPAPLHASPGKERQWKRPGLLSGEDGSFTVYRKIVRGSADPTKPEKVRR